MVKEYPKADVIDEHLAELGWSAVHVEQEIRATARPGPDLVERGIERAAERAAALESELTPARVRKK